jgi:DNA uptake protein ComE-like DNA-binding protein
MNRLFFLICLVLLSQIAAAQDVPAKTQEEWENMAEAREEEDPQDDSYLLQLDYFLKNPLDLNTATEEELQGLRLLNGLQIANLLHYRQFAGKLINIYELQAVPGWDLFTINKILPYISLSNAVSIKQNLALRFKNGNHSILTRVSRVFESSKGYDASLPNHYLGDPNHILFRYRYQYKNLLQYGIVGDKDAGEQFFKGAQSKGFDFYSVHLFIRNLGIIKSLALGDYTISLGQGLIQWQSFGFGKGTDVMGVKHQSPVLLPYRSAGEFNFNRGIGVTVGAKNWEGTAFLSYKKMNANIVDSVDAFSGILYSGLNRTYAEIRDKNSVADLSAGGNINFHSSKLKLGLNSVIHKFSKPFQKREELYNLYAFTGNTLWNGSIDYSFTIRNMHFFGEAAIDRELHSALINGALISLDPKVDVSIVYRSLSKAYQTIFGNAFTENTLPVNEKGLYAGIVFKPYTGWQLNAYTDLFSFPWIKYRVDAPSKGREYMIQLEHQPSKETTIYLLYRNKNKPLNEAAGNMNFPEDKIKQSFRINLDTKLERGLSFKARLEACWYNNNKPDAEHGFLGFIEGARKIGKWGIGARVQYFESGGYNSRIYAYETDVPYSFSIPAFFDTGFRYYINTHYKINNSLSFSTRWSRTIFHNVKTIKTGLDEINGNAQSDGYIQLQLSF